MFFWWTVILRQNLVLCILFEDSKLDDHYTGDPTLTHPPEPLPITANV